MAILLISPEPWDAHAVSKHHYARTLAAEGHQVVFLDPPVPGLREISFEPVSSHPGVVRVRAPRVAPGLRRMPAKMRRWLETRWLRRLEQRLGSPIEVVWLFENSRFFDLHFGGSRLRIYHQVDLNQNFYPAIAARTADICFCTSELIRQQLLPHNSRCYRVNHGLALAPDPPQLSEAQRQRFDAPGTQALYIGNLEMAYLDVELMETIIRQHPDVQFHLVGGYKHDGRLYPHLAPFKNVHWWGKIDSALIPAVLERADVLLVCYRAEHHRDQSNPHKLMEYLASGRTIVATYTEEYAHHTNLIAMSAAGSNAGYPALFSSVLTHLPLHNAPERMAARRAFAAEHTYPRQLNRIREHLGQHDLHLPTP